MKGRFPILVLLACAAALVFGVIELFKLRFETGDIYPVYSSLRSDPLGTMALYESLGELPGISVTRDYSTANKLPESRETAYLHLASDRSEWGFVPEETFREIDGFLARGGRLVIALYPDAEGSSYKLHGWQYDDARTNSAPTNSIPRKLKGPSPGRSTNAEPKDARPAGDEKSKDQSTPASGKAKKNIRRNRLGEEFDFKGVSIQEHWGVDFEVVNLAYGEGKVYEPVPVRNQTDLPLPPVMYWHSGVVMPDPTNSWRTVYARGTNAVVIERKFGLGSVVIATDCYFLSNEAMQKDRHADFLAWVIGPNRTVVFDEAHLGVMEASGVAMLMRKYRLYWLIAGLVMLAILFIWKNSVSLVPPHRARKREDSIPGKAASAGFINLIRRNVPPRDLLATCFAEWKKSAASSGKHSAARVQQAEAIYHAEMTAKNRNISAAYRDISAALRSRPRSNKNSHDNQSG